MTAYDSVLQYCEGGKVAFMRHQCRSFKCCLLSVRHEPDPYGYDWETRQVTLAGGDSWAEVAEAMGLEFDREEIADERSPVDVREGVE